MPRKCTPAQEIINLRAKGEITNQQAARRLRALAREEKAQEAQEAVEAAKAERSVFRRVLDFFRK